MNGQPRKCCANCTSFDQAEGCWNAVSFIELNGERRRAMADDCCHDHEFKLPEFHIVGHRPQGGRHGLH
ncbi:hypothetical protein NP88_6969 [Burkholderia cepacia]|uniref:hypothetical protein n=1 Tax=Burkholderia cenocepacia TaxID=95486 RepID=UPI0005C2EFF9|nr:hypothetical protein [Burkholderia cenocepacia]KIS48950.1 hypothetical protein NP88_6969 [Burkholderia cepacia]ONR72825.1 hypothetical protein A8E23_12235 [Burkholderia cenocepacia]QNN05219.1 hypothetical protein K562_12881 [Burkholderia cenocepacia]SPU86911.1 Uncharacterised protein [Burkholderia cenocepacia]SPV00240.1 Uncharacterised protein [Burkholderia cenocepacia]